MTTRIVMLKYATPTALGDTGTPNGWVHLKPTRKRDVDDTVVLPAAFKVKYGAALMDGDTVVRAATPGTAWARCEITDGTWGWTYNARTNKGDNGTFLLPAGADDVPLTELEHVDPDTFDPLPSAQPAWEAADEALRADLEAQIAAVEAGDVDSVAGLSGTVSAPELKTALDLPDDTEAELAVQLAAINAEIVVREGEDLALQADIDTVAASARATNPAFTATTLAEKCRKGMTSAVGIAGDSTMDKPYEAAILALTRYVQNNFPRLSMDYYEWDGTSAYLTVQPLISGVVGRVTAFRDEFTRVATDLIGSTPDIGSAWTAGGNGTGDWTLDGTDAIATADASRGFAFATVPAGDIEVCVTAVVPASQTLRLFLKYVDSSNYLAAYIAKNSSGGQYRMQLIKLIGGVQTTVWNGEYFFVNPQIPEEELDVTARVVGTRFTASINGVHSGGTLAAGDVTATSASTKTGIWGSAVTGVKVRRFQANALVASTAGTMSVYNGSKSGTVLSYQEGLISTMFPAAAPLDLLIVNSGHNYGSASPATYQTAIDSFVTALRVEQPTVPIAVVTQNPRNSPATTISEHAARVESLPAYCATNGYSLIPTYSEMLKSPIGLDLMQTDGVHPTGGWTGGAGKQAPAIVSFLQSANSTQNSY